MPLYMVDKVDIILQKTLQYCLKNDDVYWRFE